MATYKTSDLLNKISELINSGYEYVDIDVDEDEEDSDFPVSLHFDGLDGIDFTDCGEVNSCVIPNDYDFESSSVLINPQDYCGHIAFTHDEIFTIKHALDNALEYFKECVKDPRYSNDTVSSIKEATIKCRNLQAKLAKCLKKYHFS